MARPGTGSRSERQRRPTRPQARALGAATVLLRPPPDEPRRHARRRRPTRRDRRDGAGAVRLAVEQSGGCATPLDRRERAVRRRPRRRRGRRRTRSTAPTCSRYLQDLAKLGAHPVLLVARAPYTRRADAVAWWQQVAQVADIVREVYVPATRRLEARAGARQPHASRAVPRGGRAVHGRSASRRAGSGSWSASSRRQGGGGRNGSSPPRRGSRS